MWLSVIGKVLTLLVILTQYLAARRSITAAESEVVLKLLQETQDAIDKAQAARARVRADLKRHPERVYDPDQFERKD